MSRTTISVLLLCALSGFLALNIVSAKMAIAFGADPFLVLTARNLFLVLFFGILIGSSAKILQSLSDRSIWQHKSFLALGALISLQGVSLYFALDYLPVFLTALLFNMHPFFTLLWQKALKGRPIGALEISAFALLFLSLALCLDLWGNSIAWNAQTFLGMALVLFSSNCFSAMIQITQGGSLKHIEPKVRTFNTMLIAALFSAAVFSAVNINTTALTDLMPYNAMGWGALAAVCLFYTGAMSLMIAVLPKYSTPANAVILSSEPLIVLALSSAFFAAPMSASQITGASLGIIAVGVLFWQSIKPQALALRTA